MAVYRGLLLFVLVGSLASLVKGQITSAFQTADIIASNGYPSETHHVTTSDGYILEMHRIPHGKDQTPSANKPVVFLMHGITAASNSYILLGPELAPPYNLADAGFDVWLGNARGNRNSRFHVTLNPDDDQEKLEFFDFSFEEIAIHDLPAMIEYVLKHTGQGKLHYIGHSQGGTVFLVLVSMRPEFNDKIASAHLLAGVGYQDHFPDTQLATIARFSDIIYNLAVSVGFVELFSPSWSEGTTDVRKDSCGAGEQNNYMCELVGLRYLMRDDVFDDFGPAGAALKQIAHYGQNIRDSSFRRWSYGIVQNMAVYGTANPPIYDLSLITINVTMHYTINDDLLDERDVIAMANDMPNTSVRKVARDSFLHSDFVTAPDAKELVTDYIIEALWEASEIIQENEADGVTDSAHNIVFNNTLKICLILLAFINGFI